MAERVVLATRGSALAMAQTREIQRLLEEAWPGLEVEILEISTSGDQRLEARLSDLGGKGAFTLELEDALLAGRADLAVHSLKDLPTALPEGLALLCTPQREETADLLLLREPQPGNEITEDPLSLLPEGAVVGTSSLRRRAQLLSRRPDLQVVEFRGNVQTRLRKLEEGQADAAILAMAGLKRLGLLRSGRDPHRVADRFDTYLLRGRRWLSAVGQGAIGIEGRSGDPRMEKLLAPLRHGATRAAVDAERAFLRTLGAGCQAPVAAEATVQDGRVSIRGVVFSIDGRIAVRAEREGAKADAAGLGKEAALACLEDGARALLRPE